MIPHDLTRRAVVGLRADEGDGSILAIHQQLPLELLTEQVLGLLVVHSSTDWRDDPDRRAAWQIIRRDLGARDVGVVHAGKVDEACA